MSLEISGSFWNFNFEYLYIFIPKCSRFEKKNFFPKNDLDLQDVPRYCKIFQKNLYPRPGFFLKNI